MAERVNIKETPDFLMITIRANTNKIYKFGNGVLLFGWIMGFLIIMSNMLKGNFEDLYTLPFGILVGIYILLTWLWEVYGKEEIVIDHNYFIVTRGFFKYGPNLILCIKDIASIGKTKSYGRIKFWQILSPYWGNGGVEITCNDGKKYSFGLMLRLEDKELIYEMINSYLKGGIKSRLVCKFLSYQ
jgi:hypothetical protein